MQEAIGDRYIHHIRIVAVVFIAVVFQIPRHYGR
jgi:hypothetical protein